METEHFAQVWSCGGGTQSVAIAALIVQGLLPKPDHALIVDTKRERSSTWEYADAVLIPNLRTVGVDLVRVDRDDYTDIDLYGGSEETTLMLPVFTAAPKSKLPAFCSGEWKRDVASRYMRKTLGLKSVVNWIGYSTDELRRVSTPRRQWMQLRYPLIDDVPMNREGCRRLVAAMGWPSPPRSSCWMCPNHSDDEWRDMRDNHPKDFAQAVEIERQFHKTDPDKFLHRSRMPLDQVDFSTLMDSEPLTRDCTGGCFT